VTPNPLPPCRVRRLGRIDYPDAQSMQEGMVGLRRAGKIVDTLLLLEHPHVVTLGSRGQTDHILADAARLRALGIRTFEATRGGDVTYHGPGQIVGYPILLLEEPRRDAHRYLRDLEDVLVRTLGDFGIAAQRHPEYTGVWVGDAKIAAIGVRLTRWITSHGFALNVHPDLGYFETIVPCGIEGKSVTSMQALGHDASLDEVEDRLVVRFGEIFQREMQPTRPQS
jgi:lipoyl(octanoyl) transferase